MQTTDGATPLYMACWKGDHAVAGLLLDRGADVNQALVRCAGGERACSVLDGMLVLMLEGVQAWGLISAWGGRGVCRWCCV